MGRVPGGVVAGRTGSVDRLGDARLRGIHDGSVGRSGSGIEERIAGRVNRISKLRVEIQNSNQETNNDSKR